MKLTWLLRFAVFTTLMLAALTFTIFIDAVVHQLIGDLIGPRPFESVIFCGLLSTLVWRRVAESVWVARTSPSDH